MFVRQWPIGPSEAYPAEMEGPLSPGAGPTRRQAQRDEEAGLSVRRLASGPARPAVGQRRAGRYVRSARADRLPGLGRVPFRAAPTRDGRSRQLAAGVRLLSATAYTV